MSRSLTMDDITMAARAVREHSDMALRHADAAIRQAERARARAEKAVGEALAAIERATILRERLNRHSSIRTTHHRGLRVIKGGLA